MNNNAAASAGDSSGDSGFSEFDLFAESPDRQKHREFYRARVVGQEAAIEVALDALDMAFNPLRDPNCPIYKIYELGVSRTGKTLIAEVMAEFLHGSRERMIKINGGAYKERHELAKLLGAPPGYIGYDDNKDNSDDKGNLDNSSGSAKLSRQNIIASRGDSQVPVSIILIDEANLMHPQTDDVWMSILDKGTIELGNNSIADFRDCIFFFTSNMGMEEVEKRANSRLGFAKEDGEERRQLAEAELQQTVMKAVNQRYRPEWRNRIDEFVVFKPHSQDQLLDIVQMELDTIVARVNAGLQLQLDDSVKRFLLDSTFADNGNLANLKRQLQKLVVKPLGAIIMQGLLRENSTVVLQVDVQQKRLRFFVSDDADENPVIELSRQAPVVSESERKAKKRVMRYFHENVSGNRVKSDRIIRDVDGNYAYLIYREYILTCKICQDKRTWHYHWLVQSDDPSSIDLSFDPHAAFSDEDFQVSTRCINGHVQKRTLGISPVEPTS